MTTNRNQNRLDIHQLYARDHAALGETGTLCLLDEDRFHQQLIQLIQ